VKPHAPLFPTLVGPNRLRFGRGIGALLDAPKQKAARTLLEVLKASLAELEVFGQKSFTCL